MRFINEELFGNYDLEAPYRNKLRGITSRLGLSDTDREVLFVCVCLSTTHGGVCRNPETARAATADTIAEYLLLPVCVVNKSLVILQDLSLIIRCADRGSEAISLTEFVMRSVQLVWTKNKNRMFLIRKPTTSSIDYDDEYFEQTQTTRNTQHATHAPNLDGLGKLSGYIYVIYSDATGLYKIGRSRNPNRRIKDLMGGGNPFKLKLLHVMPTRDAQQAESIMHQKYHDNRHGGEWFELSRNELSEIMSMKEIKVNGGD